MTAWSDLTVVTDDLSSAAWACTVRDRVINPFASAATRDATITGLVTGMHTHLADTDHTYYRAASGVWAPVAKRIVGARQYTGTITSSGTEVAMAAWTVADPANVTFEDKHLYRLDCTFGGYNAGTAYAMVDNIYRCRSTINSIVAQEYGAWRLAASGGSTAIVSQSMSCYVYNATGANLTKSLGLTVQKSTGGNASLTGGVGDTRANIVVWDCGSTSRATANQLTAMLAVSAT